MIPKTIHYCWFGNSPFGSIEEKCIESWNRLCPEFEIVRWDESNFDVNSCDFAARAYRDRNWAFVSDYARFVILYKYGGIYFDTDVEVVKPLDDLIDRGPFLGLEKKSSASSSIAVAPGLGMGAYSEMSLLKKAVDYYQSAIYPMNGDKNFINIPTVVDVITRLLIEDGLSLNENSISFCDDFWIYPPEYLSPLDFLTGDLVITPNTYTIHHYAGSWLSEEQRSLMEKQRAITRFLGPVIGPKFSNLFGSYYRLCNRIDNNGILSTFKYYLNLIGRSNG